MEIEKCTFRFYEELLHRPNFKRSLNICLMFLIPITLINSIYLFNIIVFDTPLEKSIPILEKNSTLLYNISLYDNYYEGEPFVL